MNTLKNIPYAVTTNFSVKDQECDGGSKTLAGYRPIFNATVIDKLNNLGAVLKTQANVTEFAIDINGGNDAADLVAKDEVTFALGSDCNGALRLAASKAGITGYKPTYGLISRFGLYAVASTMDTVGIYCKSVADAAFVAEHLKGLDASDMNTWQSDNLSLVTMDNEPKKLFYIKEMATDEFVANLKTNNIEAEAVAIDINLIKAIIPVHKCIMNAEMTTTLANLTGIPFGPTAEGKDADEMMFNYRTNFTTTTKVGLILGTHALAKDNLEKYYKNSLRLRGLIFKKLNEYFTKYDALISASQEADLLIANLCGYPSVALASGLVITGKQKDDAKIINVARMMEAGK